MAGLDKAQLDTLFGPFLTAHPFSKIEHLEESADQWAIQGPWNDDSFVLVIPEKAQELANVLNSIMLPQRFSALWHKSTKDFEIIFTAYKLAGNFADLVGPSRLILGATSMNAVSGIVAKHC